MSPGHTPLVDEHLRQTPHALGICVVSFHEQEAHGIQANAQPPHLQSPHADWVAVTQG